MPNNIIRESNSPFSSPIILVKKIRDERLDVDYREHNSNTLRGHNLLPLLTDQLDPLAEVKYFTGLDTAFGFHQISISE